MLVILHCIQTGGDNIQSLGFATCVLLKVLECSRRIACPEKCYQGWQIKDKNEGWEGKAALESSSCLSDFQKLERNHRNILFCTTNARKRRLVLNEISLRMFSCVQAQ